MPQIPYLDKHPQIGKNVFIAPNAWVTGDVILADQVSLFFGAVIRGDIQQVRVGEGTNLQEHVLLHTSSGRSDCVIGAHVTVGHRAIVHGCSIGDGSLIGMGAVVLDDAVVGKESIIGAQAMVLEGMEIPDRSLVVGVPAKVVRSLSEEEVQQVRAGSDHYIEVATEYASYFSQNPSLS